MKEKMFFCCIGQAAYLPVYNILEHEDPVVTMVTYWSYLIGHIACRGTAIISMLSEDME